MKRLILLALVLTPLALLAVDRLMSPPPGPDPRSADLAFRLPEPTPPVPPRPPVPPAAPTRAVGLDDLDDAPPARPSPAPEGVRPIVSDLRANEGNALADLRAKIDAAISDWLAQAGVPRSWTPRRELTDPMLRTRPEVRLAESRDYGDLYEATALVEFTRDHRARLVDDYRRWAASRRLGQLGSVLGFILACLAIFAGYIRTDEATRGYYTNRLRLLAAASVGAAGVVLYRVLT